MLERMGRKIRMLITSVPLYIYKNLQMISGLFRREVKSWDQKRGMDPRVCTIEVICAG